MTGSRKSAMNCPSLFHRLCLTGGLLLLVSVITQVGCVSDRHLIYEKLFVSSGYERNVLPVKNAAKAIDVELDFTLLKIKSVDDINQMMSFVGFMVSKWEDEYLTWNASDYGNVTRIIVPASLIWLPDFAVVNSAGSFYNSDFEDNFRVLIENTGKVTWDFGGMFEVNCNLILTYFPYDKQMCYMSVENWKYDKSEVDLKMASSEIDQKNLTPDGMWNVIKTKVSSSEVFYDAFPDVPFPRVQFDIFLERKPGYYEFNIVVPCAALGFLAMLGMSLPVNDGKVGFGITVIVAFSVYQLIIADSTPKSSDYTPILSIWMLLIMMTSTISTAVSILVLYMYYHNPAPLPKWLRIFYFKFLARVLFMTDTVPSSTQPYEIIELDNKRLKVDDGEHIELGSTSMKKEPHYNQEPGIRDLIKGVDKVLKHLAMITKELKEKQEAGALMKGWYAIANITDRFFFLCNLIVITLGTVICFSLRQRTHE